MRILFSGQMDVVKREANPASDKSSVLLNPLYGKVVEGHRGPDSQNAEAGVELRVKPIILADLPVGARLYVIVTDQKPEGLE